MVVVAYVTVTMKTGSEKEVLKKVLTLKEVTEVDLLYGEYDALVKVRVEDLSQLDKLLTEKLRVLPDVFQTASLIVAKQYKGK
ncbi:MAG: Lrp/AsnC family transcriptional regulator [Candidatus Hermodarchaeia archaeon]|jgi:DNA-binding Lrp family transcriptional regulator